jgi:hypothetical protein
VYRIQFQALNRSAIVGNSLLIQVTVITLCGSVKVSPDAFTHFLEILDGIEPQISPEDIRGY